MMRQTGYCTNVHAGIRLDDVKSNLEQFAVPVRDELNQEGSLGVGLWLSKTAAEELNDPQSQTAFRDWLTDRQLIPYTFNGFPFGDFHQSTVKHSVYQPTWADSNRLDYTKRLADVHATLLGNEASGTISTLPLGWPKQSTDDSFFQTCSRQLDELANHLDAIYQRTGTHIRVCLEPEPGCLLDDANDLVLFFEQFMFSGPGEAFARRYLGVCHDICHSAVMFEPQELAVKTYLDAGLVIGKVQVSAAIEIDFDQEADKIGALGSIAQFAEPRYLHQTTVENNGHVRFFEDLPLAIDDAGDSPAGTWRVHFHVPIFQQQLGSIRSTQNDIGDLLKALEDHQVSPQFEVETYAWNVLPDDLKSEPLHRSISREIRWFREQLIAYEPHRS